MKIKKKLFETTCKGIIIDLFLSFTFLSLPNIRIETNSHSNIEFLGSSKHY